MEPVTSHPATTDAVVFRPSKKRKIYRQRGSSPSTSATLDSTSDSPYAQTIDSLISQPAVRGEASEEDIGPSVAEVLRLQKARLKQRAGGVEFRAIPSKQESMGDNGSDHREDEECIDGRAKEEVEETETRGVGSRFAKQTGLIGDVDKHM